MRREIFGLTLLACLTSAWSEEIDPTPIVESLPEHLIYLYSEMGPSSPSGAERQLHSARRRWEPGRTLRVCFFGANETVATLVRGAASEWNSYSSVKFDFGPPGEWYNCISPNGGFFEVRIGFASSGYWSLVGNDSESRADLFQPSMNFYQFNRKYSVERYSPKDVLAKAKKEDLAHIKHEFGHALGLLHEHQGSKLDCEKEIRWTGPGNVYEFFEKDPYYWSRDIVDRNIGFIKSADPSYVAGDPDATSIMMYSLPSQIFTKGAASPCAVPFNFRISPKDKELVAKLYPKTPSDGLGTVAADLDVTSARLRPLANLETSAEVQDAKLRIVADLESNDAYVRRNARLRLSQFLGAVSAEQSTELISQLLTGSYRAQLGAAVAVNHAPPTVQRQPKVERDVKAAARATSDATLRKELLRNF